MDVSLINGRLFRNDYPMPKILLPPNQQLVAPGKWPFVGEKSSDPSRQGEPWSVRVSGLVARPHVWTLEDLARLPQVERTIDIHCVTRWSRLGAHFSGVPLTLLLEAAAPLPEAHFLSFIARSPRRHSTSLPIVTALELDTLLALSYEGQPLEESHGGPIRTVVPDRYFYKSVKWLEEIRVLEQDQLGYWEQETGYHNNADPWKEERYIVSNIDNAAYRALIQQRDFSGRDLLGIQADSRNLSGLNARGARLRDAHFERSTLTHACFDGANLSNAHFEGADLRHATFRSVDTQPADVEGADFQGADLRGVNFADASFFGTTFCPDAETDSTPYGPALIDRSTVMSRGALAQLTPVQLAFVRNCLSK